MFSGVFFLSYSYLCPRRSGPFQRSAVPGKTRSYFLGLIIHLNLHCTPQAPVGSPALSPGHPAPVVYLELVQLFSCSSGCMTHLLVPLPPSKTDQFGEIIHMENKDLEMYPCSFENSLWTLGGAEGVVHTPEHEKLSSRKIKVNQAVIKREEAGCFPSTFLYTYFKSCLEFCWLNIQKTHQSSEILHFLGIKCKILGLITEFHGIPRSDS